MKEVSLQDMMTARENRCHRQQTLLGRYHVPVISMTFNIPGPRKVLPSIPTAFVLACRQIEQIISIHHFPIFHKELIHEFTGYEVCYCVDAPLDLLKQCMMELENRNDFGRLLDLDVLDLNGIPVSRETFHASPRSCLLCGQPAHVCSRSRSHSVEELVQRINVILEEAIRDTTKTQKGTL